MNKNLFLKSVMGGICISIGALIYLRFPSPVGASFFAAGLLLIMTLNYKLYTGVIGSARTPNDFYDAFRILAGNAVGALLMFIASPETANEIVLAKLQIPWFITFIRACLCGGIIYGCVEAHKIGNDLLVILFVAAFILSGAEHSIADICYCIAARSSLLCIPFLLSVAAGNAVGAQIFSRISQSNT